jgi:hypothetical protein
MRASGCIVDDNTVSDQFAKTNMQAYHDEVFFFHVSNSSGLWFVPWLRWLRKLSFVHYCKTASPGARNVVWPCRRKKTKKRRRTTRRQHGFRIQTKLLDCLICLLLATNKRFWGLWEKKYCWKVALRQCYNVRKRDSCDEIDTSLCAAILSRYGCGLWSPESSWTLALGSWFVVHNRLNGSNLHGHSSVTLRKYTPSFMSSSVLRGGCTAAVFQDAKSAADC